MRRILGAPRGWAPQRRRAALHVAGPHPVAARGELPRRSPGISGAGADVGGFIVHAFFWPSRSRSTRSRSSRGSSRCVAHQARRLDTRADGCYNPTVAPNVPARPGGSLCRASCSRIIVAALTVILGGEIATVRGQALSGEVPHRRARAPHRAARLRGQAPHGGSRSPRSDQRAGGVMAEARVLRRRRDRSTRRPSEANRLITREGVKITGTFSSRLCGAASEVAARTTSSTGSPPASTAIQQARLKHVYPTRSTPPASAGTTSSFIAKHLAPRLNLKPNQIQDRLPLRRLVVRSRRDRVARAGQDRVRHAEVTLEYYNCRRSTT